MSINANRPNLIKKVCSYHFVYIFFDINKKPTFGPRFNGSLFRNGANMRSWESGDCVRSVFEYVPEFRDDISYPKIGECYNMGLNTNANSATFRAERPHAGV